MKNRFSQQISVQKIQIKTKKKLNLRTDYNKIKKNKDYFSNDSMIKHELSLIIKLFLIGISFKN